MVSCDVCGEPNMLEANFCTSCGADRRLADIDLDDQPTQTFELAPVDERELSPGEEASTLVLDLEPCPRCGAPNARPRRTCGRCEAALPSENAPDLFISEGAENALPDVPLDVDEDDPTQPPWLVEVDDDPTQPPWRDDPTVPPYEDRDQTLLTPVVRPAPATPGMREPTGRLPVIERVEHESDDEVDEGATPQAARRRWPWLVVATLGIALGSTLGWALATDAGPFGSVAAPVFDAARYAAAPRALTASEATASSQIDETGQALFSIDGDVQTAWSASPDDATPSLTIVLANPVWLTSVVVATGEPASQGGASGSGRIATAVLILGKAEEATLRLRDVPQDQSVALPQPRLTDTITIRISSLADQGPAAITELRLMGHVASASDAALLPD